MPSGKMANIYVHSFLTPPLLNSLGSENPWAGVFTQPNDIAAGYAVAECGAPSPPDGSSGNGIKGAEGRHCRRQNLLNTMTFLCQGGRQEKKKRQSEILSQSDRKQSGVINRKEEVKRKR